MSLNQKEFVIVLVHICCSVDSHFFLQELQKEYPNETFMGFFYDPNIHPYSEYKLRLLDVRRSCKKLGVELLEGEYDYEGWIEAVRGLENEPERGKRCLVCFDNRFETTAKKAVILGIKSITTTLLTSPKKSIDQLKKAATQIEEKYNVEVLVPDFRKGGGTSRQFELAKKDKLYHQNYCGCMFALEDQRASQKRVLDELMSPIGQQVLPSSIESRIELYEKVIKCEEEEKSFELVREKFLNYRLLAAFVKSREKVLPSYLLFYSHLKRGLVKGRVARIKDGIGYFNRESILFMELEKLNFLTCKEYKSVKELLFNPLKVEEELEVRRFFSKDFLSLSPIIVVDEILTCKLEIGIKSYIYEDVRELLAIN